LRRHKERDWEIKLAAITGKCFLIRREIENRHGSISRNILNLRIPKGRVDTGSLYTRDLYVTRLGKEISVLEKDLELKEEERAETQNRYLEASRDRKVLDKLKEKREAQYYLEQKREDFKIADDISNGAATRKRVTGG
jgi:flagellar FliJ protein